MPGDGKKVAIGLGIAGLITTAIILATRAKAAPPKEYVCPYCGDKFITFEDLVTHVQTMHPGERIPIEIIWE